MEKLKIARVEDLFDRGGLPEIVRTVAALGDRAAGLPAWGAEAERCRQTAVILAVEVNAWGRAGARPPGGTCGARAATTASA